MGGGGGILVCIIDEESVANKPKLLDLKLMFGFISRVDKR